MAENKIPTGKVVMAFLIDLFGTFLGFGYLVAALTDNIKDGGFELSGTPALVVFIAIIAYFQIMKNFGGTIGKRIMGIAGK